MPTWLGIDIGSAGVKVALVRSTYRKLALARLSSVDTGALGADVGPKEAIRAAVKQVLEGEAQGADAMAVAIDGSRAAIHRLTLPKTAQKQVADILAYELEAQVPFDLAGAVYDWKQLERGDREEDELTIVAAVARVEDVRARIDLVKDAIAQEPERVGVGAFALAALVPYISTLGEDDSIAIVDLGAKTSEVLVLEGGEPVFARTLSIGTEGLPEAATRLARDIGMSFAGHRARGGLAPTCVYLCGGGAFKQSAEGFFSSTLEIPVKFLPEPSLDLTDIDPGRAAELPRYAKAIALALSLAGRGAGMNLRRGPLAFERSFAWVRERIPVLAGLAAVILVSFVFGAWARLHAVHSEHASLESALGAVTKEVLGAEATTAQDAQDLLSKEAALTDEDPMPHADGFDLMVRLSDAVPSSMKHDVEELDLQKGHAVIRGVVGSIPDTQQIAQALSDDKCLNDVKIKSTTQTIGGDRQKYVLELDLKCPEDIKSLPKKKGDSSASASSAAGGSGGK
jgi:general secretion pathway protein L